MALGLGRLRSCVTIARCVAVILAALGSVDLVPAVQAADPLSEARRLYNAGQYEAAARAAREAIAVDGLADPARVVLGRIQLERFRQTADPADLTAARESFRSVDPPPLRYRERLELTIGQAEIALPGRSVRRRRRALRDLARSVRRARYRRARARSGLVGYRAGSPRPAARQSRSARRSTPASSSACVPSSRSTRDRRRRATGWRPPRAARAISIEPGRPRWPGGSAPASLRIAAPRCAPIWIGS